MKLKSETYDLLKFIAIYIIPSLETFWLTIATVWQIPHTQEIGITIGAIGVLIAGCIGISKSAYNKEKLEKHDGEGEALEQDKE